MGQFRRSHNLSVSSPLPPKEITLKITKTKVQLIQLIADDLLDYFVDNDSKLIITSQHDEPEQSYLGSRNKREDLKTTQEEADVIIPYQVAAAIADGKNNVKVICEDTDVFALLCHCYYYRDWNINLFMEGFSPGKSLICIKQTVERHKDLIPS